jgi:hypothetical protein
MSDPTPAADLARFARLQERLRPLFERVFPDPREPRTVVVVPSLTFAWNVIEKITGLPHYEERLLCMLMLLRMPRTRIVYVTSQPIAAPIVDYYLQLLRGVPAGHARDRLTLLTCYDPGQRPLTEKILERPRLVERLRAALPDPEEAHLSCFNVTAAERTLALRLGIPIYGCDPALSDLGSKSGGREIFRASGADMSDGAERLRDVRDVADALAALRLRNPDLVRAAVKLEEGTSGEGNAVFTFEGCPGGRDLSAWVAEELPRRLAFESSGMTWEVYEARFAEMGGVVEAWVDGSEPAASPSFQGRIDPLGNVEAVSTHDQILGGPSGQVFKGCSFPADEAYRLEIQEVGLRIGRVLRDRGAIGRYGVDFVSLRTETGWRHHAIEINLRKGGTTHTFRTLQFLTDGSYDEETGLFRLPDGRPRFYHATDNLNDPRYRRLTPDDIIDVAVENEIHFHGAQQRGSVFHMIGAVAGWGKLGVVCVGVSPYDAEGIYRSTVEILDDAAAGPSTGSG